MYFQDRFEVGNIWSHRHLYYQWNGGGYVVCWNWIWFGIHLQLPEVYFCNAGFKAFNVLYSFFFNISTLKEWMRIEKQLKIYLFLYMILLNSKNHIFFYSLIWIPFTFICFYINIFVLHFPRLFLFLCLDSSSARPIILYRYYLTLSK